MDPRTPLAATIVNRALRLAALLFAAIAAAVTIAGCQTQTSRSSDAPVSFWPCPAGQHFSEHRQIWGCWK